MRPDIFRNLDKKIVRAGHTAWTTIGDGKKIVLSIPDGKVVQLNSVGARIWDNLSGEKTVSQIILELANHYKISFEKMEVDFINFLGNLHKNKFVKFSDEKNVVPKANYINSQRSFKIVSEKISRNNSARIPLWVDIETTNLCNLKCVHCWNNPLRENGLTTDTLKETLKSISNMGCLYVVFTGGEFLMRHDCIELIGYARSCGLAVRVFTNATLITDEIAEQLRVLYPISVEVSVYGASAEVHDSITGRKNSFNQTLAGIELLLKNGIPLQAKTTFINRNISEIRDIERLIKSIGIDWRYSALITPRINHDDAPLDLRVSSIDLKNDEQYFKKLFLRENQAYGENVNYMCAAGILRSGIDYQGNVFPCIMLRHICGNIKEASFRDIWLSSSVMENWLKLNNLKSSPCISCSIFGKCARCPGQADLEDGNPIGISSEACRLASIWVKEGR